MKPARGKPRQVRSCWGREEAGGTSEGGRTEKGGLEAVQRNGALCWFVAEVERRKRNRTMLLVVVVVMAVEFEVLMVLLVLEFRL
ncbi:hypothetical protein E2C01_097438 [Portunus trituberculatus]|uniref:Uncharacterized protein n=1 Tax=Portunus trituberculatus TaxID=210409 RepID=A0A5B7K4G4_PORTR|nr:hypothetical protein [Portunus trituberculatus]